MRAKANNRLGEINYNKFGNKMEIIEYRDCKDIDIYFHKYNWVTKNKTYRDFKKGNVSCPYEPRLFNVGYMGVDKYDSKKNNDAYVKWNSMLARCYDPKYIQKNPTYEGCEVCKEWHDFQNFTKWYYENYYKIDEEVMCLDKDILVKRNKVYSPETCVFVPNRINVLFVKSDSKRGNLPIGVAEYKYGYRAYVSYNRKQLKLGTFNTPHEAFLMYKLNKELVIQGIANEYKNKIPTKLYEALINYEVEEGD